jgi:two-component system, OmpR family, phosphate regulon sensor histidine kinase PhoR
MAQSLMITEPFPSYCWTGANPEKRRSKKAGAKIENVAPGSLPMTRNIGCLAAHDDQGKSELARANDFYAAVLAMVTHDLRQPLQVIVGSHELLAQKLIAGPERRYLHHAQQASRELASRLDQLTDVFRIKQQSGHVRKEPVPLQPLFQRLAQELAELARTKSIDLRFVCTDATIVSSATILEGMVRNLARNALEHTAFGGHVMVGCRRRGAEIRIEVRDNGAGIAQDQVAHVFQPFTRLDPAAAAGLGLGLFIVKRAADCLGHRIEVRSAPGRGCCFAVAAQASGQGRAE